MIVLDASVLIGYRDAGDAHHERAAALLIRELDKDFAVNLLTLLDQHARLATFDERLAKTARARGVDVVGS